MTRAEVYALIDAERDQQRLKWGGDQHKWGWGDCSSLGVPDIVKVAVLAEEAGEVARSVLDAGLVAPAGHIPGLRAELVQVAAVAVAWLESMDR